MAAASRPGPRFEGNRARQAVLLQDQALRPPGGRLLPFRRRRPRRGLGRPMTEPTETSR